MRAAFRAAITAGEAEEASRFLDDEPDLISTPLTAPPSSVGTHIENEEGWTPLFWACAHGRVEVAALLLDRGAPVDGRDGFGHSALYWASLCGETAVCALLLQRGADASLRSGPHGFNPLMAAAACGHTGVVNVLLEEGTQDVDEKGGREGQTALLRACQWAWPDIVRLLLYRGGADHTITDDRGRGAGEVVGRLSARREGSEQCAAILQVC